MKKESGTVVSVLPSKIAGIECGCADAVEYRPKRGDGSREVNAAEIIGRGPALPYNRNNAPQENFEIG